MMRSFIAAPLLAGLAYAVPQESCGTVTTTVTVPSATDTFTIAPFTVTTITETTPRDDGTYTFYSTISSTTTLETVTSTDNGGCSTTSQATVYTTAGATSTAQAVASPYKNKRSPLELYNKRQACTVTDTSTVSAGVSFTDLTLTTTRLSTYEYYTTYTQATTTVTKSNGVDYVIATATQASNGSCPATVTQDARCAPTAMSSAYNGYGLEYKSDVPSSGGVYNTNTTDASSCCQLCAEATSCAASAWDSRTGACTLEFPVDFTSQQLNCGEGLLAYYDAGPDHPMAPGTGLWVQALCGNVEYGSAAPDDGT